jgi:hypothetical protein
MHETSRRRKALPAGNDLEGVGQQLAVWRQSHSAPCPLPDHLWAKAAALAAQQGVCKVARALRLGYRELKRRAELVASPAPSASATFIEMLAPVSTSIAECALEIQSPRGAQMRVVMKNVTPHGLATILREFAG